jgi:CheY-like chemotaxis protein
LSQFDEEIPPMILKSGKLHYCSSQIAAKDIAARSFNGLEAIEIWKQHQAEIQMVLTDLVMPGGINGKELGKRFLKENPNLS